MNKKGPTATVWISLDEVRISERRHRSINRATVERYRQWLEQGREAPPVRLAPHGDVYVVRDGRHRVAAALAAGHAVIEAEVRRIARWLERRRARRSSIVVATHAWGTSLNWTSTSLAPRSMWVRVPPSPLIHASVVSTASTRPLYGRGAGSTPAGGSYARSSVDRALLCEGRGRWFDSSRACFTRM